MIRTMLQIVGAVIAITVLALVINTCVSGDQISFLKTKSMLYAALVGFLIGKLNTKDDD